MHSKGGMLPVIPGNQRRQQVDDSSDRNKRSDKLTSALASEKADFNKRNKLHIIEVARAKQCIRELETEEHWKKQLQLQATFSHLDTLNRGNTHSHFHIMSDTAKISMSRCTG
jgi:hypothetical protein